MNASRRLRRASWHPREEADEAEGKSRAANARVAAAEAALAETGQALKDAQLFAPVDGVIRDRILEPGDFATPQTPVLTLAFNPVWVRTYLPEPSLGKVAPGAAPRSYRQLSGQGLSRAGSGSISPTAEFTPEERGDPGSAHPAGVPGAGLRLQPAGRAAPGNARHRGHPPRPTRQSGRTCAKIPAHPVMAAEPT